ncbi:MAG: secretin N-terminal domain-containing protein, partial [Chloroflexota bacterium]
ALRDEPGSLEARSELERTRGRLVARYVIEAENLRIAGQFDAAEAAFGRALGVIAGNPRAVQGLQQVDIDRRHRVQLDSAGEMLRKQELAGAEELARTVLAQNPRQPQARKLLKEIDERRAAARANAAPGSALGKPVTLEFRDTAIRSVFEILSRTSGINFVFDREVRPDIKVTIFVRNSPVDEVVKLVLATTQLASKPLNANSILIFPNTPQKNREYEELVAKSFYLASADVKQAATLVKTIVKSKDVFVDEKLNLLVVKDTPDAVRLVERLLESLDIAEPEVMLEVEVLEIARSSLLNLGLQFPEQIGYGRLTPDVVNTTITTTGSGTSTTFGGALAPGNIDLRTRIGLTSYVANPVLLLNLKDQDGSTRLLANPRIRVKNREKAKIHIGEKVPVFTTTST